MRECSYNVASEYPNSSRGQKVVNLFLRSSGSQDLTYLHGAFLLVHHLATHYVVLLNIHIIKFLILNLRT